MGDKGYVVFGAGASEATVKVLTTVCLLKGTAFKHVDVSFDDAALGEEDKLGVKTDTWKSLTAGRSNMPAIAIDGVMHMESELICRKLAKESGASTEVLELIDLSLASSERMIDAVKHWAWSGLHASMGYAIVNKDHYTSFGQGTQTDAWEKESGKVIDTFMKALEAKAPAGAQWHYEHFPGFGDYCANANKDARGGFRHQQGDALERYREHATCKRRHES